MPVRRSLGVTAKRTGGWLLAQLVLGLMRLIRLLPTDGAINAGAWVARTFGPLLPAHRVGADNLRHAFPDKSEAERRRILRDAWDSLGRMAVEFVFLDRVFDYDPDKPQEGRVRGVGAEPYHRVRLSEKPCILFTAHLANWEMLPICAARFGLELSVLFRPINNAYLSEKIDEIRGGMMGDLIQSRKGALIELSSVLEKGGNVGLLVDQRFHKGFSIPFFGRPAKVNPALGKLARQYDADIYAARSVRLPGNVIHMEMTGPIEVPRDASGAIDVEGTMVRVTQIVEEWVREHPGQWLWMHRRWRP